MAFFRVVAISLLLLVSASEDILADDASFEERVRTFLLENPEVILEALTLLSEREAREQTRSRVAALPDLFSESSALGLGRADAPIQVVEFFDYKCLPCKAVHPVLEDFVAKTPDVRIEMRHLPILTPGSERASRFALAVREVAGESAYAEVHSRLWQVRGPLNAASFERIAEAVGLDFEAIAPVMESQRITDRITYNRDAAIALEILGTPAFVTKDSVVFGSTDIDGLAAAWLSQ